MATLSIKCERVSEVWRGDKVNPRLRDLSLEADGTEFKPQSGFG